MLGAILSVLAAPTDPALASDFPAFLGALGLGLGMTGLVLVYKRVGGFLTLIWQMLVFFSGALATLPGAIGLLSRLQPLSWGIAALRAALVNGATAAGVWQSGLLPGLLLNTAVYLALGIFLFRWDVRGPPNPAFAVRQPIRSANRLRGKSMFLLKIGSR